MSKPPPPETGRPRPFVCGCSGTVLTEAERAFFTATQPFGFILMGRNCAEPAQVRALIAALRGCVQHPDVPILIDLEGGRVARLKPPHWPKFPPPALIGALYHHDEARGIELATLVGTLIGQELHALGINVDCAPVLDVAHAETHQAIGDRAFSADPRAVGQLGHAFAEGLLAAGVLPVIKHLPGHGRATVDPHLALPVVLQDKAVVEADYVPFRMLAAMPLGMTSHILFQALDAETPASQSRVIVRDVIRRAIGFNGLLFSDDLDMKALGDTLPERCRRVLAAGTDVLLICNTPVAELAPLADLPAMTETSWQRWERARKFLTGDGLARDKAAQQVRLAELVARAEAAALPEAAALVHAQT